MARRPPERERICLDGGRRTTQLMRDSLGANVLSQLRRFFATPAISESASDLLQNWRSHGVLLNKPATSYQLWRIERALGWSLPSEFRGLYRRANGMLDLQADELEVSMWSIDRILAQRFDLERSGHAPEGSFLFADVAFSTYFFALDSTGWVHIGSDSYDRPIGPFHEFLYLYWADPRSLGLDDRHVGA